MTTTTAPTTAVHPQQGRLDAVRELAATDPSSARDAVWDWLTSLDAVKDGAELAWLFAQGTAPASPDGDTEGAVLGLMGTPFLGFVDRLVRVGQALGGIGWTGKSFDADAGTGFNRLTWTSRLPMLSVMPTYRFRRRGGELLGFDFDHRLETSPVAPYGEVRSIHYDRPEYGNPLMLPNTRDELVELVPGALLGRGLLRDGQAWKVVAFFVLREPAR